VAAEAALALDGFAGGGCFGFAGDRDGVHAQRLQVTLDGWLAVSAVGGDRAWHLPGTPVDALHRGRQLRGVGHGAVFDAVAGDDSVVVAGDLGLVPELDRFIDAAFADRAGVGIVQADQPGATGGGLPRQPGAGLATIVVVRSIVTAQF